jgi:hypothetical protein
MKTPSLCKLPHVPRIAAAWMLAGSVLWGVAHASDKPPVPALAWADCTPGPEFAPVECAKARVPLDHDRPNGELTHCPP